MSDQKTPQEPVLGIILSDAEKARQKRRSKAIAWGLAGLCVLFYVITVLKMGPSIFNRTL